METSRPKSFSRAPPGSLQPCQGRNHRAKPSVVRARDASHTRIPAQEPKDRQSPPLFRVSLEVQTLRDEVLGIIFDPKPGESDHCNITGHKGRNLLRRIARKAWWEEGFAPPLKGLPCSTPGRSTANGSLRSATVQGNPAHQGAARPAGR